MPAQDFKKELSAATTSGRYPHLSHIKAGDNEGSIAFTFHAPTLDIHVSLEANVTGE